MKKEKLKLLISNLEMLLDELKSEVCSDIDEYKYEKISPHISDYDEVFNDNDVYPD